MDNPRLLRTLRKTRKAFIIEYFASAVLIILSFIIYLKNFPKNFSNIGFMIGFLILIYAEGSRLFTSYKIQEDKIIIVKGIIKHERKAVYYHPLGFVPDINIRQGRIERLLGYGTIYVKAGASHTFEIKDINSPHKILELIEGLIKKSK